MDQASRYASIIRALEISSYEDLDFASSFCAKKIILDRIQKKDVPRKELETCQKVSETLKNMFFAKNPKIEVLYPPIFNEMHQQNVNDIDFDKGFVEGGEMK